jgi:hypothetical protein
MEHKAVEKCNICLTKMAAQTINNAAINATAIGIWIKLKGIQIALRTKKLSFPP